MDDSGRLNPPNESASPSVVGMLYDGGDLSATFLEFKAMLDLEDILHMWSQTLKLMVILQFG